MLSPSVGRLWQCLTRCWLLLHFWALTCCMRMSHWSLSAPPTSTSSSARCAITAPTICMCDWQPAARGRRAHMDLIQPQSMGPILCRACSQVIWEMIDL